MVPLFILCGHCLLVLVGARCYTSHYPLAVASFPYDPGTRSLFRRGRRLRKEGSTPCSLYMDPSEVALASTKSTGRRKRDSQPQEPASSASPRSPFERKEISYAHLSPLGKVVAGTIEITVVTLIEFATGFASGYLLGTLTDMPRLMFRANNPEVRQTLLREMRDRGLRMHGKSLRWARTWGGISAAFAGFDTATKVLRGGVEDEWSKVISSVAAGAYFGRKGGPRAMVQSAVLYGGMMYVFSGGMGGSKKPFQYEEQPVDF